MSVIFSFPGDVCRSRVVALATEGERVVLCNAAACALTGLGGVARDLAYWGEILAGRFPLGTIMLGGGQAG